MNPKEESNFAAEISFNSTSLYVGDLGPDVNEDDLRQFFGAFDVISIKVCKDATTRRSLGYAYVNFGNHSEAERAIEQLNTAIIKDRPCRIMYSQRDPSLRKSGKGNIFIKNLNKDIDHKALYDTFEQFGKIISCKLELDNQGHSKGYGYIQYSTQESADNAIKTVDGKFISNQKVYVGQFIAKKARMQNKFTNLYVKNLQPDITEEDFKRMFERFGIIKSAAIMLDESKKSKCFGFVNFEKPEDAKRAVEEMNDKSINDKVLYVGRAQKKNERMAELLSKFDADRGQENLYVKNLPEKNKKKEEYKDEDLKELFSRFGTITSAKVMYNKEGNSKGFGFVCFSSAEEARKARQEMHLHMFDTKPLYVNIAQKKEHRRAQLEQQFAQRKTQRLNVYPNQMFYPPYVYPSPVRGPGGFPRMPYGPGYMMPKPQNKPRPTPGVNPGRGRQEPNRGQVKPRDHVQLLGDRLYPKVSAITGEKYSPKITGMILDGTDIEEIRMLLQDNNLLSAKVHEAMEVLNEHQVSEN